MGDKNKCCDKPIPCFKAKNKAWKCKTNPKCKWDMKKTWCYAKFMKKNACWKYGGKSQCEQDTTCKFMVTGKKGAKKRTCMPKVAPACSKYNKNAKGCGKAMGCKMWLPANCLTTAKWNEWKAAKDNQRG